MMKGTASALLADNRMCCAINVGHVLDHVGHIHNIGDHVRYIHQNTSFSTGSVLDSAAS